MSSVTQSALAALAAVVLVAGCASTGGSRQAALQEINRALNGTHRSLDSRARDEHRHPRETLLFFGLRPGMHVVEIWPEPGWYTEIIAPVVREEGKYHAAVIAEDPESRYITNRLQSYRDKLASRPDVYGKVELTTFAPGATQIAPAGSVDMVLTFRNIHNWMARGWAEEAFAAMYRVLKPGGVLGVVEHRGDPQVPQDPQAKSGYVNEDYAIRMIEAQGFRLVAKSEINANPRDTKDYPQGVWTLPPTYRLGDQDRDKYTAIGESDRFTLKFEKPR